MSIDNTNKDTTVTENKRLTSGDLRSMFLRSNVLLASANFERVQNLGICYIMIPAIKRLYAPGPERIEALKRHLEWFNTQPYCASPILGGGFNSEVQRPLKNQAALNNSSKTI